MTDVMDGVVVGVYSFMQVLGGGEIRSEDVVVGG
jgi:hypothetical protein